MKNTEIQTSRIQSAGSALKSAGSALIVVAVSAISAMFAAAIAVKATNFELLQLANIVIIVVSSIAYISIIGFLRTSGKHLELCMTEIQNADTIGLRTVDGLFIEIHTTGIEPNVVKEVFIDGLAAPDGEYEFIYPSGMRIVVQDGKIIG